MKKVLLLILNFLAFLKLIKVISFIISVLSLDGIFACRSKSSISFSPKLPFTRRAYYVLAVWREPGKRVTISTFQRPKFGTICTGKKRSCPGVKIKCRERKSSVTSTCAAKRCRILHWYWWCHCRPSREGTPQRSHLSLLSSVRNQIEEIQLKEMEIQENQEPGQDEEI